MKNDFQAALKKKKRKLLKDKANQEKRKKLKMLLEGDTYEIPNEQELFSLKKVARAKDQRNIVVKKVPEPESKDESNSDNDEDSVNDDSDDSMYERISCCIFSLLYSRCKILV